MSPRQEVLDLSMPKEDECLEDEVKEEFDMIDSNVKETEEEVSSSSDVIDHAIQSEEISNSYEDKVITNMEQEEKEQITEIVNQGEDIVKEIVNEIIEEIARSR